jgi:hypothetical protein
MFALLEQAGFARTRSAVVPGLYGVKAVLMSARKPE